MLMGSKHAVSKISQQQIPPNTFTITRTHTSSYISRGSKMPSLAYFLYTRSKHHHTRTYHLLRGEQTGPKCWRTRRLGRRRSADTPAEKNKNGRREEKNWDADGVTNFFRRHPIVLTPDPYSLEAIFTQVTRGRCTSTSLSPHTEVGTI